MKIGIIGGGQLAQMLALAAYPLGFKTICLEPHADCPAARVTEVICGDYSEHSQLKQLADRVDVITYEFENIPVSALTKLDHPHIHPTLSALSVSQDRLNEKKFFTALQVIYYATQSTRNIALFAAFPSYSYGWSATAKAGQSLMRRSRRLGLSCVTVSSSSRYWHAGDGGS